MNSSESLSENILKDIQFSAQTTGDYDLLRKTCDIVCDYLKLSFVGIFLLDMPKKSIIYQAGSGETGIAIKNKGYYFSLGSKTSYVERCLSSGDIWLINQNSQQIFNCSIPSTIDLESNSSYQIIALEEKFVHSPLILGTWQLLLPLRTQNGRFGVTWVYHNDDILNKSIESSTIYLQKLTDDISAQLYDWGFTLSYMD